MNRRCFILAACACLTLSSVGRAFDTVKTAKSTMSGGQVVKMSPVEISYDKAGVSKEVPVNEVVSIIYDSEPSSLQITRIAVANGRYEDALAALEKIDLAQVERAEIKQDVEFYKAYCAARLALGGNGDITIAGRQMATFVSNAPGSYHWLQANEVVGDLLVAAGKFSAAEQFYTTVGKEAPWPDYKMRAGVAMGRALLAQDKPADALKYFDGVIGMSATGELADFQKMAATLGKARCLAAGGKQEEAIKMVEEIIAKADPESTELLARAYNTLGGALKAAGKTKEAILAFLHVDVLYFSIPDAHAEALANLAKLWNDVNKTERSTRARRMLEERYKNSPWAK